jgi:hypothetical protein
MKVKVEKKGELREFKGNKVDRVKFLRRANLLLREKDPVYAIIVTIGGARDAAVSWREGGRARETWILGALETVKLEIWREGNERQ